MESHPSAFRLIVVSVLLALAPFGAGVCAAIAASHEWHADVEPTGWQTTLDFGWAFHVAGAGDVNASGFSSLIVSAPSYKVYLAGDLHQGLVALWTGHTLPRCGPDPSDPTLEWCGLPSNANWTSVGGTGDLNISREFGLRATGVGDVNNDGYDDVVVGDPAWDAPGLRDCWKIQLFLGPGLSDPNNPVWEAVGDRPDAHFGAHVAGAGDVNGDEYDDILVAEPSSCQLAPNGLCPSSTPAGRIFVWHGGPPMLAQRSTTPANASWSMESPDLQLLTAVAGIGDVNNDGVSDIAIGNPSASNSSGGVFVWYGSRGIGLPVSNTPGILNANWRGTDFRVGDNMGASVAGGDIDGDGISDLVVGAPGFDNGQANEGAVLLWTGSSSGLGPNGTVCNAVWRAEGDQAYAKLGTSVAVARDFNGDTYGDIVAGAPDFAPMEYPREGAVFIWYGGPTQLWGTSGSYQADWVESWKGANASFGQVLADAGDINGDRVSDIVVGAPNFRGPRERYGRAFVYFGIKPKPPVQIPPRPLRRGRAIERAFYEYSIKNPDNPALARLLGPQAAARIDSFISECRGGPEWSRSDSLCDSGSAAAAALHWTMREIVLAGPADFFGKFSKQLASTRISLTNDQFATIHEALNRLPASLRSLEPTAGAIQSLAPSRTKAGISLEVVYSLLTTLNRYEVSTRLSQLQVIEVPVAKRVLARAGVVEASISKVRTAGTLSVSAIPGVPADTDQVRARWPVMHFVLDFSGELSADSSVTIDVDVSEMGYNPADASLRLLEWDGTSYRDITVHRDARSGTLRGLTNAPRTYLIASIPT